MKLNRRQLRRLIESVINESEVPDFEYSAEQLEAQVILGVNAHNKVLKDGGYHPECHAVPSNMSYPQKERIHFFVKCPSGSEDSIIKYLESQEAQDKIPYGPQAMSFLDLLTSDIDEFLEENAPNGYEAIEHTYSIERPGRIRVEIATFD